MVTSLCLSNSKILAKHFGTGSEAESPGRVRLAARPYYPPVDFGTIFERRVTPREWETQALLWFPIQPNKPKPLATTRLPCRE